MKKQMNEQREIQYIIHTYIQYRVYKALKVVMSCPHPDYYSERHRPVREAMNKDRLYQPLHIVEGVTGTGESEDGRNTNTSQGMDECVTSLLVVQYLSHMSDLS